MKNFRLFTLSIVLLTVITGCSQTNPSTEPMTNETSCSEEPSSFIGNPAAFYCTSVMGYEYKVITNDDGSQKGQCIMPDGLACDQWAFYSGECGPEYSYCALEEMSIETRYDGNDPYSSTYGVCTGSEERSEFKISDIIDFNLKPSEKVPSEEGTRSREVPVLPDNIRDALPAHFDWRDVDGRDWMTPVKDQGGCGSCWAFSAVGVMEPYYNFINNDPDLDLNLSEENFVSDCFYRGCDGGWSEDALIYARDVGIVDEACMPYTATDSSCASMCVDPERYTVEQVVWEYYSIDVYMLKYLIVNHGPVSVYLYMDGEFNEDIYQCAGPPYNSDTYHAVVVVGYDDAGEYWIVKNSWGEDYGDEGYYKFGYNQCEINSEFYAYLPTEVTKSYLPLISNPGTPFTTIPDITYPSEGDIVNTLKPTITWNIDPSLNENTLIHIHISPDSNLHDYSGGVSNTEWVGTTIGNSELGENLKQDTTYYLHANYWNLNFINEYYADFTEGPYSQIMSFTTGTGFNIPGQPTLISPTNEEVLVDTNVILNWEPVAYADYYEVWLMWKENLDPQGDFWLGTYFETSVDEIDVSNFVEPYTLYQWDVRPTNDEAWGEYSDSWTFTTGAGEGDAPRSEEKVKLEDLFIMDEDGKMIPYEVFIGEKP